MSVIVVGAGPAGATAAWALAKAGVTVRLLDRSKFPRNKPCGGGISLRILRRFPHLGPELSRIATHTVSRLQLEGPDGYQAIVESDEPAALMVRRVEFDGELDRGVPGSDTTRVAHRLVRAKRRRGIGLGFSPRVFETGKSHETR